MRAAFADQWQARREAGRFPLEAAARTNGCVARGYKSPRGPGRQALGSVGSRRRRCALVCLAVLCCPVPASSALVGAQPLSALLP